MPAHDVVDGLQSEIAELGRLIDLESEQKRYQRDGRRTDRSGRRYHAVTAEIDVPASGAEGLIVSQGGAMGAWTLCAHEGRLEYHYSYVGVLHSEVAATSALPAGRHQARMEFTYDGAGMGRGGRVELYVDGRKVGEGRIQRTHTLFFSQHETLEIGRAVRDAAGEDAASASDAFNGVIHWVQIDVDGKETQRSVDAMSRMRHPVQQ